MKDPSVDSSAPGSASSGRPYGKRTRPPDTRRWPGLLWRAIKFTFQAVLLTLLFVVVWGFWWEPSSLTTQHVSLELPRLTETLRIAAVSDLHIGAPNVRLDRVAEIVEAINEEQPDLILFTGDFVIGSPRDPNGLPGGRFVEPELIAAELEALHAPLGVYAVLGNHDWWSDGERVQSALRRHGITVLENQAVPLRTGGQTLWIGGIADLWTRQPDIPATLAQIENPDSDSLADPVILFSHNPDIFFDVPERVDLLIGGHTHGGQVVLPLYGRVIETSRNGLPISEGYLAHHGSQLFITTGIGTSIYPIRIGVPPEIAILTVTPPSR